MMNMKIMKSVMGKVSSNRVDTVDVDNVDSVDTAE